MAFLLPGVSGVAAYFHPHLGAGAKYAESRPASGAHRVAQPVRRVGRPRQLISWRPLQVERTSNGCEFDEQLRALQLPPNLQRNSLRDAVRGDRGDRVSLLIEALLSRGFCG